MKWGYTILAIIILAVAILFMRAKLNGYGAGPRRLDKQWCQEYREILQCQAKYPELKGQEGL